MEKPDLSYQCEIKELERELEIARSEILEWKQYALKWQDDGMSEQEKAEKAEREKDEALAIVHRLKEEMRLRDETYHAERDRYQAEARDAQGASDSYRESYEAQKRNTLAFQAERDEFKHHLLNILARIHRDGGHYVGEHGIEKSVKDGDNLVSGYIAENDALKTEVKGLRDRILLAQRLVENREGERGLAGTVYAALKDQP